MKVRELEQSQQALKNKKNKLSKDKENLTQANAELKTANYQLNALLNASQMKVKELEQSQQALKNEKNKLSKDKENLTQANAELAEKIKALSTERDELIASHTDKSELDLQNRRFKSAIEDLKRQNRKLEEENIALKERVGEG